MKKLLAIVAITITALFGFAPEAEAGRLSVGYTTYYNYGHHSCGCAKKFRKVFRGYDHCGTPIWSTYSVRHRCNRGHRSSVNIHFGNGGYSHRDYYRPRYRSHYRAGDGFRGNGRRYYSDRGGRYCR